MSSLDSSIDSFSDKIFEGIKFIDNDSGIEYWSARDLQEALEYTDWRNFQNIINKARIACKQSGFEISDHFVDINKMVTIGSSSSREIEDVVLSRYACYLVVQNGDPGKNIIALGQTYFAKSTRENELSRTFEFLPEDEKRLHLREDIRKHNKSLAEAASLAGIVAPYDFAIFQNKGYQGLYGGLGNNEIKERKGLKKNDNILDHMGSTELAANLFRATQADEQLRKHKIHGKSEANELHRRVGEKVRDTIRDIGGTMPEDLPTPRASIKELEKRRKQSLTLMKDKDE